MPGLLGIIANHDRLNDLEIEYLSLSTLDCKKKAYTHLRFERFTNPKFLNDKVFEEDDEVLIGIEGIIFNYADLRSKFSTDNNFALIKKMYKQDEASFFNDFRGEFSGFVYDKKQNIIQVFTNHTSSKNIFYYFDKDLFVFASEVKVITQILNKLGKSNNLSYAGAYSLLTYGFMLHDFTLVEDVKKLLHGHSIKIQLSHEPDDKISFSHKIEPYFRFTNEVETKDSKSEIIEKIDAKFKQSITREYQKDLEYNYRHIATLSGGLDSRMSVMMADKLGFKNITTMTFSETDYWDERIAKQIAHDKGFEFLFMALNHGNFFKDVDSPIISNDGLVFYGGASHHLRMTSLINPDEFGLQHTGMLGDAIFGTYLKNTDQNKVTVGDGAYSQGLISKIEPDFRNIAGCYTNAEIFKLYNRGFNGMFNGYWMAQQFTEFTSAFLDVDLLSYTLSIPAKYKHHEQIYIDWIRAKHRDIGKYKWEQTMTSVNLHPSVYKFVAYSRRVIRALKRRLRLSRLYSMNPIELWYRSNPSLRNHLQNVYDGNIEELSNNKELMQDCIKQYNEGNFAQKMQVLTLLRSIQILNLK